MESSRTNNHPTGFKDRYQRSKEKIYTKSHAPVASSSEQSKRTEPKVSDTSITRPHDDIHTGFAPAPGFIQPFQVDKTEMIREGIGYLIRLTNANTTLRLTAIASIFSVFGKKEYDFAQKEEIPDHVIRYLTDQLKNTPQRYFNNINISVLCFGLSRISQNSACCSELLTVLTEKINEYKGELDAQAIGNTLYGLHNFTSENEAVKKLIKTLTDKITTSEVNLETRHISMAFYGLRGMSSNCDEIKNLIKALTILIINSTAELNEQTIGNLLYGLQGMSSESEEIQFLLIAITDKIKKAKVGLTGKAFSNALYGLQNMCSDKEEVKNLISVLIVKIVGSAEIFNAQQIGNALYGLQNMRSDSVEIKELIRVLSKRISVSPFELDAQAVGMAFYGLQNMNSESEEVKELIRVLTEKICKSVFEFDTKAMGMTLYGLQSMTSEGKEVKELIKVLTEKICKSTLKLDARVIANALYGLINMPEEVAGNLRCFLLRQMELTDFQKDIYSEKADNLRSLYQTLQLSGLPIPKGLLVWYEENKGLFLAKPSEIEISIQKKVKDDNPGLQFNTFLEGFETDIYDPVRKLNIELDGPSHNLPSKKLFDQRRDAFLKAKDIRVVRIIFGTKIFDEILKEVKNCLLTC